MKIHVYNDPFLLDFIQACIAMPADERAQVEALVGQPYDIDRVAVGNFTVPGPKWVAKLEDNTVLAVGGFAQQRPGVWRDYMLTTPTAWQQEYWFQVTRSCRRIMEAMFTDVKAHRLECVTPLARIQTRPEVERWYKVLGYKREGIRKGYCANGADAVAYARVRKHGNG